MHAFFAPLLALLFLVPGGGWLGVYLAADHERAVVAEVIPDSPAAKAGLKPGDVIVAVGDTKTATREELIRVIGEASPGDRVRLGVERDGKPTTVVVKLGKRPSEIAVSETAEPAPAPTPVRASERRPGLPGGEAAVKAAPRVAVRGAQEPRPYLGVSITEEIGGADEGVSIDRVLESSPAAAAGLQVGDILRKVGDKEVASLDDLDGVLKGLRIGKPIKVEVERQGKREVLTVTPGARAAAPAQIVTEKEHNEEIMQEEPVHEEPVHEEIREEKEEREHEEHAEHAEHEEHEEHGQREKGRDVEREIDALRAELKALRKQLDQLRKQLRK